MRQQKKRPTAAICPRTSEALDKALRLQGVNRSVEEFADFSCGRVWTVHCGKMVQVNHLV